MYFLQVKQRFTNKMSMTKLLNSNQPNNNRRKNVKAKYKAISLLTLTLPILFFCIFVTISAAKVGDPTTVLAFVIPAAMLYRVWHYVGEHEKGN